MHPVPGAEHAEEHRQEKEKPGIKRPGQPTISVLESWEQESCQHGERRHTVNGTPGGTEGVSCETRRGGGHTDMPGGWRHTISLLEAREGRSWRSRQGQQQKMTRETSVLGMSRRESPCPEPWQCLY